MITDWLSGQHHQRNINKEKKNVDQHHFLVYFTDRIICTVRDFYKAKEEINQSGTGIHSKPILENVKSRKSALAHRKVVIFIEGLVFLESRGKNPQFLSFQKSFLGTQLVILLADWLQAPYNYKVNIILISKILTDQFQ